VLRLPLPRRSHTIDYTGSAILVGAVTSLLLVTLWGGQTYAWGSGIILGLIVFGLMATAVFVWWEQRATEPIFPPHLFANPIPAVSFVITLLVAAAMFAAIIFIPIYLQLVDGVSPALSGVLLLPLMGGMLVTSIGSGQIVSRIGRYKAFPVAGTALMTLGMWLLSHLGPHTSHLRASAYMVVFGLGMGMVMQILVLAVQNSIARGRHRQRHLGHQLLPQHRAAFGTACSAPSSRSASATGCRCSSTDAPASACLRRSASHRRLCTRSRRRCAPEWSSRSSGPCTSSFSSACRWPGSPSSSPSR